MAKVLLLNVKENKVINTDEGIGAMDNTEGIWIMEERVIHVLTLKRVVSE